MPPLSQAQLPPAEQAAVEQGLQEFVEHVERLKLAGPDGNSGFAREFSLLRARMLAYVE